MTDRGARPHFAALRARIAEIEGVERKARQVLPFGIDAIDSKLPGGGLALGSLHEIAGGAQGVTDGAAPALFAADILARVSGSILWLSVRDHFLVEDETGGRYWVFRQGDGMNSATGAQSCFLHGLFG